MSLLPCTHLRELADVTYSETEISHWTTCKIIYAKTTNCICSISSAAQVEA